MNKLLIPLVVFACAGCVTTQTPSPSTPAATSATSSTTIYAPPSSRPGDVRTQALASHPEWTPEVQGWVKEGRLGAGMTPEAVQASWGTAAEKKSSSDQGVAKEEWVYSYPKEATTYHLFFENGRLASWTQEKK